MKARLGPAEQMHRRAAPMLLEALALWYQQRVHAVISVGADAPSSDLGLADGLGYGAETVHYEVAWVDPHAPRGRRVSGLGDFRDVPGVLPFYCDPDRVGRFAVDPRALAAGEDNALFKLFVGLSMYQA